MRPAAAAAAAVLLATRRGAASCLVAAHCASSSAASPSLTATYRTFASVPGKLESAVSPLCRNATYLLSELWTNDEAVRESLGIHKGTVLSWLRCDFHLPYTMDIDSAVDAHLTLITKGYRTMVYRFTRTYSNNWTYATVKGVGHTTPEYLPRECLAMVDRWLSTEPL